MLAIFGEWKSNALVNDMFTSVRRDHAGAMFWLVRTYDLVVAAEYLCTPLLSSEDFLHIPTGPVGALYGNDFRSHEADAVSCRPGLLWHDIDEHEMGQ